MSKYMSKKFADLEAYTPGEQPQDMEYTKLNTNESPFPPSEKLLKAVYEEAGKLNLYCDPECRALKEAVAGIYGVAPENILPVNGSDEILYFAFMAFCDESHPISFPDISYGFYEVHAEINHIPAHIIPLREDFSINHRDYCGLNENIVIANPNAPTGISLSTKQIEEILMTNPDNVVIIDEAYVDFGGESCVPLISKYPNLLVAQTFSKSRSMAGARLGFGIAHEALIKDLDKIKYSTNPYNINRMTQTAGIAACEDNSYYMANCKVIMANRNYTVEKLQAMGFKVLPSSANFIFAKSENIEGGELYRKLKEKGVLVRHFNKPRISDYCRISIGTRKQMDVLLDKVEEILKEKGC